jgi:thiol-disulfide isomerase/thioredoxin
MRSLQVYHPKVCALVLLLQDILDSVSPSTLVVVDFYKTACGACKYIMPGFVRLCKQWSSDNESDVEIDLAATTAGSSVKSSATSSISSIGMSSSEEEGSTTSSSSSGGSTEAGGSSSSSGGDGEEVVVFVKHNVYDDEEETVTDLGRQYVIKVRWGERGGGHAIEWKGPRLCYPNCWMMAG